MKGERDLNKSSTRQTEQIGKRYRWPAASWTNWRGLAYRGFHQLAILFNVVLGKLEINWLLNGCRILKINSNLRKVEHPANAIFLGLMPMESSLLLYTTY